MKVNLKNLKFTGELAYYKDKASEGYVIRVLGSHNGTKWEVLGEEKGTGLPGEATRQQVSSDPNKFQDVVRLPLRKLNVNIPLKKQGNYEHVRIEMKMKVRHGGVSNSSITPLLGVHPCTFQVSGNPA